MASVTDLLCWRDYNVCFVLHAAIETPAALNFMFLPGRQIRGMPAPQAYPIVRQYALLLLSSVLIAAAFAYRPTDDLTKWVAGSFSVYHLGPTVRSWNILTSSSAGWSHRWASEAGLYFVVHVLCGIMLFIHATAG